ncbi:beta-ketoacyl synthase N-terminal-like domain-containing protein [Burkholderia stagnalis]|uniref:beta-ketoacyl synthase N-terminal-like domain-containing protein n=1 Tax=Burkholderia stagnalis TaxID=1503054 RepID=UPI00075ABAE3|nr:beta-ketoacyl synthase N-terminal-like domain-containing protein [Burkholderia stagnalis]KVC59496.1 3-oxoacyl-ACP synthase [Burkholderia stagnalis]KVN16520.1 3-oxoacyl-ACP synthase [Burkholderia stagnalis]KWI69003.1 3-oxoacyl-ACP synthase [Burkholderia stagnalis]KWK65030.1 3-oxoacyl-ACP synthase [Burkholderia stagnalis]KWN15320.1 3-oxoacyl-ACP synthase [Burkholderia stagnalis]
MRRAVITGIGIASSIGSDVRTVREALRAGRSAIVFSETLRDAGLRSHVWAPVEVPAADRVDRRHVRFMTSASLQAFACMQQAIDDARLSARLVSNERTGVVVGNACGVPLGHLQAVHAMRSRGLRGVGAYDIIHSMPSVHAACLAVAFGVRGVSYAICGACAASAQCIGHAVELIRMDKQDVVFAGGAEELCWEIACQYDAIGALSTRFNDAPARASRTYDADRDGFVISGGAGIVVVEEMEHALERGAPVYAEVIGYGATTDGIDMVVPSGEGAERSMKLALRGVDLPIDYLNTHGTSTPIGDIRELTAIRNVFGDAVPPLSSTKSTTGHAQGAAGVHEFIYALLMLDGGFIAPSVNIERLDDGTRGMDIVTATMSRNLTTVMTNSFGFGGVNATLVMTKAGRARGQ